MGTSREITLGRGQLFSDQKEGEATEVVMREGLGDLFWRQKVEGTVVRMVLFVL